MCPCIACLRDSSQARMVIQNWKCVLRYGVFEVYIQKVQGNEMQLKILFSINMETRISHSLLLTAYFTVWPCVACPGGSIQANGNSYPQVEAHSMACFKSSFRQKNSSLSCVEQKTLVRSKNAFSNVQIPCLRTCNIQIPGIREKCVFTYLDTLGETKLQPSSRPGLATLGCSLVS